MKKIICVVLILILILSLGNAVFAYEFSESEIKEKFVGLERTFLVNEDGYYYKTVNDVTLYVKLEKENYVVGDTLKYNVQAINYGDEDIGIKYLGANRACFEVLSFNDTYVNVTSASTDGAVPGYIPTFDFCGEHETGVVTFNPESDRYFQFSPNIYEEKDFISEYDKLTKSGIYTLFVGIDFSYGEFGGEYFEETNSNFTPADDEVYEIFLAIDIPVYESESDIRNTEIPVVPGPEKTKLSYYEKYPEPTKPIIEESTTVAPTTKVTTTETTTITPSETIKQDASIIPSRIGYIIIALSVGVIITAVIIFVVVNKKRK